MGGNAINGSVPIKVRKARKVGEEIAEMLLIHLFGAETVFCDYYYNDIEKACILGSVYKKREYDMCGDIDIAIELPYTEENIEKVKEFGEHYDSIVEVKHITGLHIVSYGYKDERNGKIYQIDIMFTDNLGYSDFMYHSPDYTKNESNFKGLYRTNLLIQIAGYIPVDTEKYSTTYYTDEDFNGQYTGQVKEFYKYTLTYDNGLELRKKSTEGKRKMCRKAFTIGKEKITDDIDEVIHLVLGDNGTEDDTNSYESLISYLHSDRSIYTAEVRNAILQEFLADQRHNKDMEIHKRLVEEIRKYDADFIEESKD